MATTSYFTLEPTAAEGRYTIRPDYEKWGITHIEGSGNILAARVMGLEYAQYLRFCRDLLNAEVIGKFHRYPYPTFESTVYVHDFIALLNKRTALIMWEKEHPDWEKHAEELIERARRLRK